MISKISFSKMVLSDSKCRLWLFIIMMIGFLLVLPLFGEMYLGQQQARMMSGGTTLKETIQGLTYWLATNSFFMGMGVISGAVICAFSGFRYLYKKTKVDIFHSVPVKREKLFLVQYVSGLVIFAIPFVLSYLLMIVVCALNGVLTDEIARILLSSVGYGMLDFILYYNVAILAVVLTGKMLVGVLGMLVLWGYMPVLCVLISGLYERFFSTYYVVDFGQRISDWLLYLSPVTLHALRGDLGSMYSSSNIFGQPWVTMLFTIIFIIATFVGALYLYRKRPSEAAERSMAFARTMPVIKVLLTIVAAIGSGMFFETIAGSNYDAWFFVGLILGLVFAQGLIEVIYTGDIRKVFVGKKSFAIAAACVLLIVMVFRFDLLRYDRYRPNPDRVETVGISIGGVDDMVSYRDGSKNEYVDATTYRLKYGKIEDIPAIYEIVDEGIKNGKKLKGGQNIYGEMLGGDENSEAVAICFKFSDGKKVYRSYQIDTDKMRPAIEQIYALESFKEVEYPIFQLDVKEIERLYVRESFETRGSGGKIQIEDYAKVIEAYKADLRKLKLEDVETDEMIGEIEYEIRIDDDASHDIKYPNESYRSDVISYPIYKACHQTIELLRSMDYKMDRAINQEDIKEIRMRNKELDYYEQDEIIITDKGEIEEILACRLTASQGGFYQTYVSGLEVVLVLNEAYVISKEGSFGEEAAERRGEDERYYTLEFENVSKAVEEMLKEKQFVW